MYIHAYKYIYTCTCIYIHTRMSVHIHTYTHTHTHTQHVHMHTRKHAWNDGTAATARRADADARRSALLFLQRYQPHLAPPTLGLHCTHFLRPQYPLTPHLLFPTYPRIVRGPWRAQFYYSTLINTTEYITLKKLCQCSFTTAPCVVVERLEGKQR